MFDLMREFSDALEAVMPPVPKGDARKALAHYGSTFWITPEGKIWQRLPSGRIREATK